MYRYETHLHTAPVSKCARASVRETLEFYKEQGYDGVFITNHFLDGNANVDRTLPYEEQIHIYFSDYEAAVELSREIGIKVFLGVEHTYGGTDFLVYGLDKTWYLAHPEIMEMEKSKLLTWMIQEGALVIQAHPYREANYIDHIRLYPRCVHGVEIINACRKDFENHMAEIYAREYGLIPFAGTDNHVAGAIKKLAGMQCLEPVESVEDFMEKVKAREMEVFCVNREDQV